MTVVSETAGIFIIVGSLLVVLGIPTWALIDIVRRPAETFEFAGKSKANWMIGVAFCTLLIWPIGLGVAVWYLTSIRRGLSTSVHG